MQCPKQPRGRGGGGGKVGELAQRKWMEKRKEMFRTGVVEVPSRTSQSQKRLEFGGVGEGGEGREHAIPPCCVTTTIEDRGGEHKGKREKKCLHLWFLGGIV